MNVRIIPIVLAAVAVGVAVVAFFVPGLPMQIVLTTVIVALLASLLVQMSSLRQQEAEAKDAVQQQRELQDKYNEVGERLRKANDLIGKQGNLLRKWDSWQKVPPVLYGEETLGEKLDVLQKYLTDGGSACDLRTLKMELQASLEAYDHLRQLQRQVTIPYQQDLQMQDCPIDAKMAHRNLANTVRMGMQLFDGVGGFYSANPRKEQELNLRVLKGEQSEEAALAECVQLNDNPMQTSVWLRALRASMLQSGITPQDGIIFSGYKL